MPLAADGGLGLASAAVSAPSGGLDLPPVGASELVAAAQRSSASSGSGYPTPSLGPSSQDMSRRPSIALDLKVDQLQCLALQSMT